MNVAADGWELHELGNGGTSRTVLLLPGALGSHVFYEDLAGEPALTGVRLLGTALPGYAGTPPPADDSIEAYAAQAGRLAAAAGATVVVGHSLGANVAIELAASGTFAGALVLISPSFSRKDESIAPRVLDRLAVVLGHLPYALVLKLIGRMFRGALPAHRVAPLTAVLQSNDPRFVRRNTRTFLRYYDRHRNLAARLCGSGLPAWVVFGEHDDVKLQDDERRTLEACPTVKLTTIAEAGHFALNTHPAQVAELVLDAIAAVERPTAARRS